MVSFIIVLFLPLISCKWFSQPLIEYYSKIYDGYTLILLYKRFYLSIMLLGLMLNFHSFYSIFTDLIDVYGNSDCKCCTLY